MAAIEAKEPEDVSLKDLAKIDDPRIVKWFGRQSSTNPSVRAILKRIVESGKKLPAGVSYSPAGPDRREEIFSTGESRGQATTFSRPAVVVYGLNLVIL